MIEGRPIRWESKIRANILQIALQTKILFRLGTFQLFVTDSIRFDDGYHFAKSQLAQRALKSSLKNMCNGKH